MIDIDPADVQLSATVTVDLTAVHDRLLELGAAVAGSTGTE